MKIHNLKLKIAITILIVVYALVLYFTSLNCPFDMLLKIPCPGCGMTRAWIMALKLDFVSAFSYHKMFWSIPVLFVSFLFDGKIFKNKSLNIILYLVIGIGFLVNWLMRLNVGFC